MNSQLQTKYFILSKTLRNMNFISCGCFFVDVNVTMKLMGSALGQPTRVFMLYFMLHTCYIGCFEILREPGKTSCGCVCKHSKDVVSTWANFDGHILYHWYLIIGNYNVLPCHHMSGMPWTKASSIAITTPKYYRTL